MPVNEHPQLSFSDVVISGSFFNGQRISAPNRNLHIFRHRHLSSINEMCQAENGQQRSPATDFKRPQIHSPSGFWLSIYFSFIFLLFWLSEGKKRWKSRLFPATGSATGLQQRGQRAVIFRMVAQSAPLSPQTRQGFCRTGCHCPLLSFHAPSPFVCRILRTSSDWRNNASQ